MTLQGIFQAGFLIRAKVQIDLHFLGLNARFLHHVDMPLLENLDLHRWLVQRKRERDFEGRDEADARSEIFCEGTGLPERGLRAFSSRKHHSDAKLALGGNVPLGETSPREVSMPMGVRVMARSFLASVLISVWPEGRKELIKRS